MKRIAVAVLEYLLGFMALAVFAALAFSQGAPSDDRLLFAFKVGGGLAVVELAVLTCRAALANRLVVGANLWLAAGGLAALTRQWWWLEGYRHLGESGLFIGIAAVGLVTTLFSEAGFVGVRGERRRIRLGSVVLLVAVLAALAMSVRFRGSVQWAAVVPVIALSWLNRLLKRVVEHRA